MINNPVSETDKIYDDGALPYQYHEIVGGVVTAVDGGVNRRALYQYLCQRRRTRHLDVQPD
ncbi:MAG: hypothetical protein Q9P01_19915 [Anaerolineae bacterium]|nr:hypothetical protein [Anaerolineae bacterium]